MFSVRKCLMGVFAFIVGNAANAAVDAPDFKVVEEQIRQSERTLSAQISVAILNPQMGGMWSYKGDERVPVTSTFKTLLCAKLLQDADNQLRSLNDKVKVDQTMLVEYSPVIEESVGEYVTLGQACAATMQTSDNTAANIVLESTGGPAALTAFIRSYGDQVTRLDRFETQLNEGVPGDARDTTSARAMVHSINQLLFADVLSASARKQLIQWMKHNTVTANLLRSVLPEGWSIADRSGAGGYGARSINAVVWTENAKPWIIAIYLSNTKASFAERNKAIVEIGQRVFRALSKTGAGNNACIFVTLSRIVPGKSKPRFRSLALSGAISSWPYGITYFWLPQKTANAARPALAMMGSGWG